MPWSGPSESEALPPSPLVTRAARAPRGAHGHPDASVRPDVLALALPEGKTMSRWANTYGKLKTKFDYLIFMLDKTQHEQGVKGPSYMFTTYVYPVWSSCWRRVAVGCTHKAGYMIGVDSAMDIR